MSDIEYIAHYLLLTEQKQPKNLIGKSIPEILRNFKSNKKVLNELADNYLFIKKIEIFNQIAFSSSSSKISGEDKRFDKLAGFLDVESGFSLKKKLNTVLQFDRESFSAIIQKK